MSPYESHTGLAQSQGAVGVVAGASKPRVRARRGQATDPHSIAERVCNFISFLNVYKGFFLLLLLLCCVFMLVVCWIVHGCSSGVRG